MDSDTILKIVLEKLEKNNYLYEALDIGGGGFSKVYRVKHEHLGKRVLKIMDYNKFAGCTPDDFKRMTTRFINEAKLLQKVHHQNVAAIHDAALVKIKDKTGEINIPYLIMDYINGKSLDRILEKGPLGLERIFKISREILSGLEAIHREGIIHRDIKSSNIMIKQANETAILIDFGLAKDCLNKNPYTDTGSFAGTYQYMSPEQFEDLKKVTIQSDIYSFGVLLYEMLSGDVPFKDSKNNPVNYYQLHKRNPIPNILRKRTGLPREIKPIIDKAMAKKPGDRYISAMEFLDALESVKGEIPANKPVDRNTGKFSRNLYIYVTAVILVIAIIIAAFTAVPLVISNYRYRELMTIADRFIKNNDYEKAKDYLNRALKVKDTREARWLLEIVADKQRETMKKLPGGSRQK
jgi:serine/threonine protein kinase